MVAIDALCVSEKVTLRSLYHACIKASSCGASNSVNNAYINESECLSASPFRHICSNLDGVRTTGTHCIIDRGKAINCIRLNGSRSSENPRSISPLVITWLSIEKCMILLIPRTEDWYHGTWMCRHLSFLKYLFDGLECSTHNGVSSRRLWYLYLPKPC